MESIRTELAGAAVVVALVVGAVAGVATAAEPEVRTPVMCERMHARAEEIFEILTDLNGAVDDRGEALGQTEYAVADAEVNHLIETLGVVEPKYDETVAGCLGGGAR